METYQAAIQQRAMKFKIDIPKREEFSWVEFPIGIILSYRNKELFQIGIHEPAKYRKNNPEYADAMKELRVKVEHEIARMCNLRLSQVEKYQIQKAQSENYVRHGLGNLIKSKTKSNNA